VTGEGSTQAEVYDLTGPGLSVTYRRSGELAVEGNEWPWLSDNTLDADVTVAPEIGMFVTAVLLPSSRDGTRVTLTLLLPETNWQPSRVPHRSDVTGVAIITRIFTDVVGGAPPILQAYEVRPLKGTASDYDPTSSA
jgi:hypothetical protein